ncbi:MAG: hypothetical protein RLZZ219_1269 [Cyanobacteriota bacterium]|jgi:dienelactone hydrolase
MTMQRLSRSKPLSQQQLRIPSPAGQIRADLSTPAEPIGLVIFSHGAGSNRLSPRNRAVAQVMQRAGLATLLPDLAPAAPTSADGRLAALPLQSERLQAVIDWSGQESQLRQLPLALVGSSTGAAVALEAAAARADRVAAVLCRGGRPDLAFPSLSQVRCPVLLIVGEHDLDVLELNAWAAAFLQVRHELVVIPHAGHLFAEPGCLEAMAQRGCQWLLQVLRPGSHQSDPNNGEAMQSPPSQCSTSA